MLRTGDISFIFILGTTAKNIFNEKTEISIWKCNHVSNIILVVFISSMN